MDTDMALVIRDALDVCAATGCSLIAFRRCECCHRPCCDLHARWIRNEFVIGSWAVFVYACYECVRGTSDPDEEQLDQDADAKRNVASVMVIGVAESLNSRASAEPHRTMTDAESV